MTFIYLTILRQWVSSPFLKTLADNLLTPNVIQDIHFILSLVEKKIRFLMKTFQDFLHIMHFL